MSETANKQAKYNEPSDNVDGLVDTKCKKKIEELLRYIVTRFLFVWLTLCLNSVAKLVKKQSLTEQAAMSNS